MATTPRTASFTRPNDITAYASGDLVANSTTAGLVAAAQLSLSAEAGGSRMVRRLKVRKSGIVLTSASFRAHLYSSAPTAANGDNAAWSTNGVANYLGAFDVTMDRAFTDGAFGIGLPVSGSECQFDNAGGLFCLLEARAAYTPIANEVFTVEAETVELY